jgi:hypothetical protein
MSNALAVISDAVIRRRRRILESIVALLQSALAGPSVNGIVLHTLGGFAVVMMMVPSVDSEARNVEIPEMWALVIAMAVKVVMVMVIPFDTPSTFVQRSASDPGVRVG